MSRWTHIAAVIDLDTCIESKTLAADVLEKLRCAPKIAGSERDAEIFVNQSTSQNVTETIYDGNGLWTGECEEYNTRVIITVVGDLRDKSGWKTRKEWKAFLSFVENDIGGCIRNISCRIVDDWKL